MSHQKLVALTHHELSVEDDVAGEDEGAESSVDDWQDLILDEDGHDGDDHETQDQDLEDKFETDSMLGTMRLIWANLST